MTSTVSSGEVHLLCIFRLQNDGSLKHTSWFTEPREEVFAALQYASDNLQLADEQQNNFLRLNEYRLQILRELGGQGFNVLVYHDVPDAPLEHATDNVFYSVFKYSSIGMALVGIDGKWLQVNDALCDLLKYSRDELLNMSFQEVTHPEDVKEDLNYLQLLLDRKIETYQLLKRYITREGKVLWAQLNVSLIWRRDGTPRFLVAQIQDQTESIQYRDHLEKLNYDLEEAQKTARIATFLIDLQAHTITFSKSVRELVSHWKGTMRFRSLQQDLSAEQYEAFLNWISRCQDSLKPEDLEVHLTGFVNASLLFKGRLDQHDHNRILGVVQR
ncbi:PAS domain S-box protein [Deinococcus roseus]|nr:PAS domain S-box protein [Deinococcus roseus]